jgi:hypothetical protein
MNITKRGVGFLLYCNRGKPDQRNNSFSFYISVAPTQAWPFRLRRFAYLAAGSCSFSMLPSAVLPLQLLVSPANLTMEIKKNEDRKPGIVKASHEKTGNEVG